jgi:hypothetical protein
VRRAICRMDGGGKPRPRLHGLRKRGAHHEARAGGVFLEARP